MTHQFTFQKFRDTVTFVFRLNGVHSFVLYWYLNLNFNLDLNLNFQHPSSELSVLKLMPRHTIRTLSLAK